ncbi:T9SS type A sorting domain-containing protein [Pedobacter alpinus]|uniref:T9SS type A sorting domain-containing protein n=1 Tax=Pedobacter alpinus TaxID=1590643 RepID=A0ABW5TUI5_9SPHI
MKKFLLKKTGRFALIVNLFTITGLAVNAQSDGEFRTRVVYSGFTATNTWQTYTAAAGWANTSTPPGTGSIVTIRDGVGITSNSNGIVVGTLNVGEGNAAIITSTIVSGAVTGLTIVNAGQLSSIPPIVFQGSATTSATASVTSYKVTGIDFNFGGSGYTSATTVTFAASPGGGTTATGQAIISGGKITGINITNQGSGYLAIPAITIADPGIAEDVIAGTPAIPGGTGASFGAKVGIEAMTITNAGAGYTSAPAVFAGSYFQVGNNTTARSVTIENLLNFRSGSNMFSGGATAQTLLLGGNLTVVSPISFRSVNATQTGNTNVTFNKDRAVGEASINGGNITFNNLTLSANTTVNNYATITVLGTTNLNDTGVLPVALTSFTAKNESNKVRVSWTTLSETNNDRFEVLKSVDGINFTKIASVKAKGSSIYSVDDYYPFNGTNYYKLLQYDLNGTVKDEGVRFANFSFNTNEISSSIYPNPIKSSASVFVKLKQGVSNTKLTLFSSDGKIVHEESVDNVGEAGYELKIKNELKPGMYFLNISSGNSLERLKVVVQ